MSKFNPQELNKASAEYEESRNPSNDIRQNLADAKLVQNYKGHLENASRVKQDSHVEEREGFMKMVYASETFVIYENLNQYNDKVLESTFKDKSGKWHDVHFGQNLLLKSGQDYSESGEYPSAVEKAKYVQNMIGNKFLMDEDAHIFYKDAKGNVEDTGMVRETAWSHLDAGELYDDSFTMREFKGERSKEDDPYGKANVAKNTLYVKKGNSYEPAFETNGEAIQKVGSNVFVVGGSIRKPEPKAIKTIGEVSKQDMAKAQGLVSNSQSQFVSKERD